MAESVAAKRHRPGLEGENERWGWTLWQGSGKTILLITHDIEEAIYLADRLFVTSHKPGQILRTVDLDRPRSRSDAGFVRLREEVLQLLQIAA